MANLSWVITKKYFNFIGSKALLFLYVLLIIFIATAHYSAGYAQDNAQSDFYQEFSFKGFIDSRGGARIYNQNNQENNQENNSIAEIRLNSDLSYSNNYFSSKIVADLIYDDVAYQNSVNYPDLYNNEVDLIRGQGWLDLREANINFTPFGFVDVKLGRQFITWGVGDLLFINDFFPKDWNSFFIGRSDEYLKAPTDAIKLAFFLDNLNLDVVISPNFNPDRYIDGSAISFYNPMLPGQWSNAMGEIPTNIPQDEEVALRLSGSISSMELGFYYYNGFYKSPEGYDMQSNSYIFPKLQVYGASIRLPALSGIISSEIGYYDTWEEKNGSNPLLPNDEFKYLIGYEKELLANLTMNFQYYGELLQDYDNYVATLPKTSYIEKELRQVLTLRLTYLMLDQKLILSWFNFYSPTDSDGFIKSKITYKITDNLALDGGANILFGKSVEIQSQSPTQSQNGINNNTNNYYNTYFGQFHDNSNVFFGVRYSF
jgi:hypothetical protein